jgi:hypothetical protein
MNRSIAHPQPHHLQISSAVLYGLTLVLALALPFEIIQPALTFQPWFVFTNLELFVCATAVAWAVHVVLTRRLPELRTPLTGPAMLFLLAVTLSALLAPAYRIEALKFVTRFAFGVYACFLIVNVATIGYRLAGLIWAIILGAGVSALVGLGEAAGWPILDPILALFKETPTRVGGELRVSATFHYATIAAMFFEMSIPLALVAAASARARIARFLALAIAGICTVVVVLTLTRAGMATLAGIFGLMLGLAWIRPQWRTLVQPTVLAALALVGTFSLMALRNTAFLTRLTTENDLGWYNASYIAPAALTLKPGDEITTTIEVRNTGQATWTVAGEYPFALAYRWLSNDGQLELNLSHVEVLLPRDVAPGEAIRLDVLLQASLPPGEYRLAWEMLQHNILWFHERGVPQAETVVRIEPGAPAPTAAQPAGPDTEPRGGKPAVPPTVTRRDLWRAALRMWTERPLLGVGPDNFRHLYSQYLGLAVWDDRVHANNLYLELLADVGLPGTLLFGWLLLAALSQLAWTLRRPRTDGPALWVVGLGASLLAFLVHGLLDYFLEFVSTYLLFWIILGLIVVTARAVGDNDSL